MHLIPLLDDIVVDSNSRVPLKTVRTSLRYLRMRRQFEDFASKIRKFRSALTLATILALRTNTNENNNEVAEHLKEIQLLIESQAGNEIQSQELLKSIRAAIEIIQQDTGVKLHGIQHQIQNCLDGIQAARSRIPAGREGAVLRWINFRQLSWRFEEVPLAYQKTFDWIFKKPDLPTPEGGWDDFTSYLQSEDVRSPYFINGKAGSGKSTLVKYIVDHSSTKEAPNLWTGTKQLLVTRHFFWNLGTRLQKSSVGMLRALIYSILERYPELIPTVLPDMYWKESEYEDEPTYMEMKKAFQNIKEKSASFLKLRIFIDGIDEYDGDDHRDLSLFLCSLASANVKLVVSSRPIPACINVFEESPSLRLQDLTRRDMDTFVRGELSSHRLMIGMGIQYPDESKNLVSEIKRRAEGVFLWVKLVVCELVEGLEAGDDMMELLARLRSLPSGLRELYQTMIGRMRPEYQIQAAEIFQLFHNWNVLNDEEPLKALVLALVVQPPSAAFQRKVAPLEGPMIDWLAQHIESRVRSRCCGLLEFHRKADGIIVGKQTSLDRISVVKEIRRSVVAYLHRTVAEFLTTVEVWGEICNKTKGSGFDPMQRFAAAHLTLIKGARGYTDVLLPPYIAYATKFCRASTELSDETFTQHVTAIDETMNHFLRKYEATEREAATDTKLHWSAHLYHIGADRTEWQSLRMLSSVLTFGARNNLHRYLKRVIPQHDINHEFGVAMAINAMESWRDLVSKGALAAVSNVASSQDRLITLRYIIEHVVRPEESALDTNLWRQAFVLCHDLWKADRFLDCGELMKIFLETSKNVEFMMSEWPKETNSVQLVPLLESFHRHDDPEVVKLGINLQQLAFNRSAS